MIATIPTVPAVTMTVTAPLRHLCPVVEEADKGTVTATWQTAGATLELHLLAAYFATFRHRRISHEDLTDQIRAELAAIEGIAEVTVETTWTTAGMQTRCSTSATPAARP